MNIAKIFKELCNTLYFQQEPFSPRAPLHAANTRKWIKMSEIKRPSVPASPV